MPPIESVIMDKCNHGRSTTSEPTSPTSADPGASPGFSDAEPWAGLYECAWFRSLVWLIDLLSLATAANILWIFPWGGGSYDLKDSIGSFILSYLEWFGFDLAVILLFTITSLSLCHAQDNSDFRWTWKAETRPNRCLSKCEKLVRRTLLIIAVPLLTASSAAIGFLIVL